MRVRARGASGLEEEEATWRTANTDPVVRNYREQISDNDLKILEALNKRVKLVKSLKDYKDTHGFSFYDPAQEDWVITYSAGPTVVRYPTRTARVFGLILHGPSEAAALGEPDPGA